MTHEIMNSIAPISSLANTLKNTLQRSSGKMAQHPGMDDLELGIDTIKRRSEGLLKFAETLSQPEQDYYAQSQKGLCQGPV
jgi:hypothetical protein